MTCLLKAAPPIKPTRLLWVPSPTRTCHELLSSGGTNHLELLATGGGGGVIGCSTYGPMGKALKGDFPEVEVVLTRQRHARTRSTILNSSFACSTAGSKVKE